MELLIISFVAGALTVLAPCILPVLPLIIGGSVGETKQLSKPFIITGSLAVSVFLFTLLLRASTALLGVPQSVWQIISGGLIIILGLTLVLPKAWDHLAAKFNARSSSLLGKAGRQRGFWRDVATGAALGPVFSSCSPTYAFIIAVILPRSWTEGAANLAAYTLGLAAILLLIAFAGQRLVTRLGWASNPTGWFRRVLGLLFVAVGIAVLVGLDRDLQTFILERGWYAPIEQLEHSLRS